MATAPGRDNSFVAETVFVSVQSQDYLIGFGGNGQGWTLNGGSVVTNDLLTLTDGLEPEARSAFFNGPQFIGAFQAQFVYRGSGLADGAAFVMQNAASGPGALGVNQSGLGYHGISSSAAIELNICDCTGGTGTIFGTNGVIGYPIGYISTLPVELGSGDPIWVLLDYDGSNLAENLVDLITGAVYDVTYAVDIPAAVGHSETAYIGFTGSDGDAHLSSIQTVTDFAFGPNEPLPTLSASVTGNQITISWPSWALNYALAFATNLTPPIVWHYFPQAPEFLTGQATVTMPIGMTNTFFRLQAP
jgi:hypothetical protein